MTRGARTAPPIDVEAADLAKRFVGRDIADVVAVLSAALANVIAELPRPDRAIICGDCIAALVKTIIDIPDEEPPA